MAMAETVGSGGAAVADAASKVSQLDLQVVHDAVQTACNAPGIADAIGAATAAAAAACSL